MSNETEFIAFLHETADIRVKDISEQAQQQADINEVSQRMLDFIAGVTEENARDVLLKYEDMKNEYVGMIMSHMYISGLKDSLTIYRLLLKIILHQ